MDKSELRIMALSERLMDEGKIPWVLAPSPHRKGEYDRLPVSDDIMEDLGLVKGQHINSILFEAITEISIKNLIKLVEKRKQEEEDSELEEDFDFRKLMKDDE